MSEADSRKIVEDILRCLQNIFKKSTRGARERAWKTITSGEGKSEIDKLVNNPGRTLKLYQHSLTFKEWLRENYDKDIR